MLKEAKLIDANRIRKCTGTGLSIVAACSFAFGGPLNNDQLRASDAVASAAAAFRRGCRAGDGNGCRYVTRRHAGRRCGS